MHPKQTNKPSRNKPQNRPTTRQNKQTNNTTKTINKHPTIRNRTINRADGMKITIDSREQKRINPATKYFKQQGYQVKVSQENTGDYIFNDQVAMEFKTWPDFISSITDGRLWNETQKQMENYNIHFLVLHGTNRDYKQACQHTNLEEKHINGSIARLLTYTKIIRGTGTLTDTLELMRVTAEKCLDNKTITRQFDTKTVNPAFNYLAYCIDGIKGERAKTIVNTLKIETLSDLMELNVDKLTSVNGIGPKLAEKILKAIGE